MDALIVSNGVKPELQENVWGQLWVLNRNLNNLPSYFPFSWSCTFGVLQKTTKKCPKFIKHTCWAIVLSIRSFVLPRPYCHRCRCLLEVPIHCHRRQSFLEKTFNWKIRLHDQLLVWVSNPLLHFIFTSVEMIYILKAIRGEGLGVGQSQKYKK